MRPGNIALLMFLLLGVFIVPATSLYRIVSREADSNGAFPIRVGLFTHMLKVIPIALLLPTLMRLQDRGVAPILNAAILAALWAVLLFTIADIRPMATLTTTGITMPRHLDRELPWERVASIDFNGSFLVILLKEPEPYRRITLPFSTRVAIRTRVRRIRLPISTPAQAKEIMETLSRTVRAIGA